MATKIYINGNQSEYVTPGSNIINEVVEIEENSNRYSIQFEHFNLDKATVVVHHSVMLALIRDRHYHFDEDKRTIVFTRPNEIGEHLVIDIFQNE